MRQERSLVAKAAVDDGHGRLQQAHFGQAHFGQAHFGMYAISSVTKGKVCNDDLKITAARELFSRVQSPFSGRSTKRMPVRWRWASSA